MASSFEELPDGRLKRLEAWIERHRTRLLSIAFVVMFAVSVASGILAVSASNKAEEVSHEAKKLSEQNTQILARALVDRRKSQDLSCRRDEKTDRDEITSLRRTYTYLSNPKLRAQLGPGLVSIVVQFLPQNERDARRKQALPYCDKPGYGLAENPKLDTPPKRRDFSFLLVPSSTPP